MTSTYEIEPCNKSCIYTTEHWIITISTGKDVELLYTECWNYGSFEITVNKDEIEDLINTSPVLINDIGGSVNQLEMGWYYGHNVKNVKQYSDEEMKEINKVIYGDIEDNDTDYDEEDCIDTGRLEDNGWTLEDTIYEVYDGFEIISGP